MRQKININMAERFDKVLKAKGIVSIRAFELECKISNNQVSKILSKGKCRSDILAKILLHTKFQDVNPRWLLTGEGDMIQKSNTAVERYEQQSLPASIVDAQARREIIMQKKDIDNLRDEVIKIWSFLDKYDLPKKINPDGNALNSAQKDPLHYAITV